MARYTSASQLLRPGETGLFLFTRGDRFELHADGTGSTGDWIVSPTRHVDWVFIYRRDRHDPALNELFKAKPVGVERSPRDAARQVIQLADIIVVGDTDVKWPDFAGAGRGAIRYLTAGRTRRGRKQDTHA